MLPFDISLYSSACQTKQDKNEKFYLSDFTMDLTPLLGTTFECECGKSHHIPTRYLHYGENALVKLAEVTAELSSGKNCLLIADTRTWEAAGEKVFQLLESAGVDVTGFILEDRDGESPVADDITKEDLLRRAPQADIYLAVGSGVINDLVKWVSYLRKKPYFTIPTAASMNGYGSANVAATVDGLKVLFHADACQALFAVPTIINNAPEELTASGLGDVLAKSVSSADWKLNKILFDDYYCQYSVDLLKDLEPVYLNNPGGVRRKDPEALKALFEALLYSSIAMTITGTSSPASGGEHLISHTLDMIANRDGRSHDFHGRQVGVGSILCAALYEKVLELDKPVFRALPTTINSGFWGSLSPVVEGEYGKKLERVVEVATFIEDPAKWQTLREDIQPGLVAASQLKNCLAKAGGAHCYQQIRANGQPLSRKDFINVVINANQMRSRFTILDLAMLTGVLPDQLEEVVDTWLTR
ncbi:sn-glycerol-1-phosphate dehydrogenase [Desulfopila sp. IMCC35008]|uniref:sn-glycerol-1-phosphate dehydrogenase n=1 Tax=Desulfopila sp. IMCC35008 TaxID=2653858 RepID=UPI0013CF44B2|nr:sn-glycerol-1-phosphate dehydrogenase [Desulfopila sp. IMCC35008]